LYSLHPLGKLQANLLEKEIKTMRVKSCLLVVLVCACVASGQTIVNKRFSRNQPTSASTSVESGTKLPIRRVILYSNGVAYIERPGLGTGNAQIDLSFKQSQVDDVLKSMVVLDLGKGTIGSVSYDSSMPASARTAEIPLNIPSESAEGSDDASG